MSLKRRSAAIAAVTALTIVLAGCAGGGNSGASSSSGPSKAEIDKAMSTATTIDFWSWVPDIQNEIDLFEKKYPKITVNLQNQGGATAQYQKLRAAIKSGDVPDVAQVEYSFLPSFTVTKSVEDLTPYGAAKLKSDFVPSAWSQVSGQGKVWGLPVVGHPGNVDYYINKTMVEKAGLKMPRWGLISGTRTSSKMKPSRS